MSMFDHFKKSNTPSSGQMSREQMDDMLKLAESITKPRIEQAMRMPKGDDQRNEVVKLIMALGFGIAAVQLTFFPDAPVDEFAKHLGDYIGTTVKKLKEIDEEEERDGSFKSATKTKSAWDA